MSDLPDRLEPAAMRDAEMLLPLLDSCCGAALAHRWGAFGLPTLPLSHVAHKLRVSFMEARRMQVRGVADLRLILGPTWPQ